MLDSPQPPLKRRVGARTSSLRSSELNGSQREQPTPTPAGKRHGLLLSQVVAMVASPARTAELMTLAWPREPEAMTRRPCDRYDSATVARGAGPPVGLPRPHAQGSAAWSADAARSATPSGSALHYHSAPRIANRRDMEEAHTSKSRNHIAEPPLRNAAKDEHSPDSSGLRSSSAMCLLQQSSLTTGRKCLAPVLGRTPPIHPRPPAPAPRTTGQTPEQLCANSVPPFAVVEILRHPSDPAQIRFAQFVSVMKDRQRLREETAARNLCLAITF